MQSPSIPNSLRPLTILNVLRWTTSYLQKNGIEDGRIDAEVLLAYALETTRPYLYLNYSRPLTRDELRHFKELIRRRAAREPIAYIVGHKEFWSLCFDINRDVLIPRPETECLVEAALKIMRESPASSPLRILELGTGSGAITIALASEIPKNSYIATDYSLAALKIARHNANKLVPCNEINWIVGDWLEWIKSGERRFDVIISNPPYIRSGLISSLQPEVGQFEPLSALSGGADGLDSYKRIFPRAAKMLYPGGHLLLEIGFDQKEAVGSIARNYTCFESTLFLRDYSGYDRVAVFACTKK